MEIKLNITGTEIKEEKNPLSEINILNNEKKINNEESEDEIISNPKGLENFSYNCYINSLLQCLFYIPKLRNSFIN